MIWKLFDYLYGYERLKHRGDRFFLAGEFERAAREYHRALATLADADHRAFTLESLIRHCDHHGAEPPLTAVEEREPERFVPGLDDLFELAIASKDASRIELYRLQGDEFKAGYVALVQGLADRAVALLEEAASRRSPSFVTQLELGRARSLAGDMEGAREALELAQRLSPEDREGAVLLAAVNVELGRFEQAYESLSALTAKEPAEPESTYLLGRALSGMKRVDEALEMFRKTVKLEPHFHEAFFEGGRLMWDQGDAEAAFELLARAAGLAPDEVRYNLELVELVLEKGLDEEAGLAACDRLMVTDEANRWKYLSWVAELYVRRGWKREAKDPLRKALELVPHDRKDERHEIEKRLAALET